MKKTRYEVECDISWLAKEIAIKNEVESDFYGDCYPDEIMNIENRMEFCESKEEYDSFLSQVRDIFESYF